MEAVKPKQGERRNRNRDKTYFQKHIGKLLPILFVLTAATVLNCIRLSLSLYNSQPEIQQEEQDYYYQKTTQVAAKIGQRLAIISASVDGLTRELNARVVPDVELQEQLKEIWSRHNAIFEIGVALDADNAEQMVSPHYGFFNKRLQFFDLTYDYREYPWFNKTQQGRWYEPYWGATTKTMVVGYADRFSNGEYSGVARANYSLDSLRDLVLSMETERFGYAFLLSKHKRFITHPNPVYLQNEFSIEDVLAMQPEFYQPLLGTADNGHVFQAMDPMSGQPAWVFVAPIPGSDWQFVSVATTEELLAHEQTLIAKNRLYLLASVTFTVVMMLFTYSAWVQQKQDRDIAWGASILASLAILMCLIVFGYLGGLSLKLSSPPMLSSQALLKDKLQKLESFNPALQNSQKIPTGVFIQSIEFESAYNVKISGYIWQRRIGEKVGEKFVDNTPFFFPEAVAGISVQAAYDRLVDGERVLGWTFEGVFRQQFDYSRYPLDAKDAWLRIRPRAADESVILVPDLASYLSLDETLIPGVSNSIVLSGWEKLGSGFDIRVQRYNSRFGFVNRASVDGPELYFVVNLQRQFIDAFVQNLVPLIVVAVMLFGILYTISCDKEKANHFGSNPFSVVTANTGLFFVVLVSHIQLRKEFAVPGIIYLEYFYFIMYLAILWVSVAAFLVTRSKPGQVMFYRNGQVAKIFYWPLVLSVLTGLTYWRFVM